MPEPICVWVVILFVIVLAVTLVVVAGSIFKTPRASKVRPISLFSLRVRFYQPELLSSWVDKALICCNSKAREVVRLQKFILAVGLILLISIM